MEVDNLLADAEKLTGGKVTVEVAEAKGKTLFRRQLEFDRDTTRAVVYVSEIGGKFHLKQWSTME